MKKRSLVVLSFLLSICLFVLGIVACDIGSNDGVFKFGDDFTVDGINVTIQVEEDVEFLNFNDKITVSGNASYKVYADLDCSVEITSKEVALLSGDNTYYVLATVNGEDTLYYINIIREGTVISGSLDVEFQYKNNLSDASWSSNMNVAVFDELMWEPGRTIIRYFKIRNSGTLALKYQFRIESTSINDIDVADVIDVYVVDVADDGMQSVTRSDLVDENYKGTITVPTATPLIEGVLDTGDFHIFAVALNMQTSADNIYQGCNLYTDVYVEAFQLTYEGDGFGPDYEIE